MSEWKVYSTKGVEKAQVKELELHDEWMAECYLTVTVKSSNPVSFQIGDYIDYRGERYSINYDPTVLKKARKGTYGEGFVYDSIKFVSDSQSKIVGCDFTDIVLDDNQMHYTGLPTFPFYCESVDDLLDRVQACLEELYPGRFILIGLNTARNAQRGLAIGRESDFVNAYKRYVDPTGAEKTDSYGKTSVALSVDNITCWEAITKINSDFGLNFIMRGDVVIAGINGVFTPDTFRYGKGNGLYEIERISEQDQQVITRLKAYGSEENLPTRYYAELNLQVFAHVERIEAKSGIHAAFWLDLDFNAKYFTERSKSYPGLTERPNYIVRIMANGITVKGYVSMTYGSQRCYIYSEYTGVNPEDDRDETDQAAMNAFSEAIKQGNTVYFVGGIEKGAFPLSNRNYATENLPNNMSVSRLMLPGFPNKSLYDWVKEHGGTDCDDERGIATINGFTGYFSKDKHRPWLQSLKAEDYGIRPGNIYFDGSNDTENIHPTLEGMKYGGRDVDVIAAAEQITDNGVYGEGNVPNFTITLPVLGFDLAEVFEEGATIDMKDGMCGSRSFKMASRPTKNSSGQWKCKVERVRDDSLDLWFPYKDFQIKAGDHYVLTGIKLPDEYVSAASEKLFDAAIEALQKNDTTRFTYQPRIDEIWMARQHDAAIKNGETSLHDTLHAGDIFLFKDDDLGIDEGIIIDVLTIRERGNDGIPTYEVTLRNEKQVSSIQRMIDKAVGSNASGGGAGGGGYTSRQIQSLIENYGGERFLSKLNDDTAQEQIGFLKGLWIGVRNLYEITAKGIAKLKSVITEDVASKRMEVDDIRSSNYTGSDSFAGTGWQLTNNYGNGRSRLVVDDAVFRGKVTLNELEVRKLMAMGGNYVFSPAASVIEQVDYYGYILTPGEEPTIGLLGYEYVKVPWVLRLIPLSLRGRYLSKKKWVRSTMSQEDYSRVIFYRCWLKADDGSTQTINTWKVGMLARCQTFDTSQIENGDHSGKYDSPDSGLHGKDVTNKLYWRAVTATAQGVDKDNYQGKSAVLDDGRKHNYIDLSNTSQDGVQLYLSGSDHVSAGDHIVCYGDWKDANLSHFVTIETIGGDAPAVKEFRGVGYTDGTSIDWSLDNKCKTKISPVAGNDFYAPHFYVETEGSVRDVATFMVSTDGILAEVKGVQSNGKNLLSGVMTGNGWKSGTYEDGIFEYDNDADFDGNGEWISPAEGDTLIVSPEIVITKRHLYTASVYIEGSQTVRVTIIRVGQSPELKSITGTGRVYITTELTADTYRIVVEATKIRHAQVELADGWDFAPTAFETSSTEVSSRIKQTADEIDLSIRNDLGETGININGSDKKIIAKANNFEIQNSSGSKTFEIDANGNLKSNGNAQFEGKVKATSGEFMGTVKNGQYTESDQTKFVNEITPDEGGHLAKGNISWDANGNVTFKGNGQFYGTIVTPFRELSSPWVDINNGGCIKITNNVPDLSLPVHKDLDGAEVDIVNMTSQNKVVSAAGGTGVFLHGSYEVTGIVIRSTSLVCRLKAICEDPENDDYVKWMIMNPTDFIRVQNDDGISYHAESYDCLNDSIKFNNTVSFGAPVYFPGTMLGGSPAIGVRGEEAHGEMILWFAATRNTIDFGSQYVRLNTGATQHTFTSQTDRAYMFVYNYYDSWQNVQGVWWQL